MCVHVCVHVCVYECVRGACVCLHEAHVRHQTDNSLTSVNDVIYQNAFLVSNLSYQVQRDGRRGHLANGDG
jgi:hypothetical protein